MCKLNYFGEMQGLPIRHLCDLFPATEAVSNDDGGALGCADFRNKFAFADIDRDLIFVFFESERAGHTAASGFQDFAIHS